MRSTRSCSQIKSRAIQKDRDESILKAQSDFSREKESLQAKIKEMERTLAKRLHQTLETLPKLTCSRL